MKLDYDHLAEMAAEYSAESIYFTQWKAGIVRNLTLAFSTLSLLEQQP